MTQPFFFSKAVTFRRRSELLRRSEPFMNKPPCCHFKPALNHHQHAKAIENASDVSKPAFVLSLIQNVKQTNRRLTCLLLFLGLMTRSSSLTPERHATGKVFTARIYFINHFCSAALKRKHLHADGAKSLCMSATERPSRRVFKTEGEKCSR